MGDVTVERIGHVAIVEMHRPPHNFFDQQLVAEIADAMEALDHDTSCRAVVLAAEGRSFCAGADFSGARASSNVDGGSLYHEALRLFAVSIPIVAAVHGSAIGGGLGLALVADVRVTCPEARWSANFTQLGFHPGFALTVTLPELVGRQVARDLFFTGRRVPGDEAARLGLADECVEQASVRERAVTRASAIATSAPLAVRAVKATLDQSRLARLRAATDHELAEQARLLATGDAKEGITASIERRPPTFSGA
jgi:enoyl-CoA hydratase/carnithine racemase